MKKQKSLVCKQADCFSIEALWISFELERHANRITVHLPYTSKHPPSYRISIDILCECTFCVIHLTILNSMTMFFNKTKRNRSTRKVVARTKVILGNENISVYLYLTILMCACIDSTMRGRKSVIFRLNDFFVARSFPESKQQIRLPLQTHTHIHTK